MLKERQACPLRDTLGGVVLLAPYSSLSTTSASKSLHKLTLFCSFVSDTVFNTPVTQTNTET